VESIEKYNISVSFPLDNNHTSSLHLTFIPNGSYFLFLSPSL